MKKAEVKVLREDKWQIEEDLCYDLKPLGSDNRTTRVLSNTRELDRDPFTK